MRNRFALSLSVFILSAIGVNAQSTLAEIQLPEGKIADIQSFVLEDSILLSVDMSIPNSQLNAKRFYLIGPNGHYKQFSTTLIGDSPLCHVAHYDDEYFLYHLSGKSKGLVLKAMVYNAIYQEQKIADKEIKIEGTLIGTWFDRDLFIIVYNKFTNELRILQVNKMEVLNEKTFDLPIDLKDHYQGLTYLPESKFTSIALGSAKFKLYKINNELILTGDYTLFEGAQSSLTTVVKMNLDNGEQTTTKFKDNNMIYFRSFIKSNMLYRVSVSKKNFNLKVNHLITGSLIGEKEIVRDSTFKETFVYMRVGSDFRISGNKESLYNMMRTSIACIPSVVVTEEDSCNTSLIWGTYFNEKGTGFPAGMIATPLAPMALLTAMIVTTAIKQMAEPPGVSRYFYLESNCENLYKFNTNKLVPLRQIIDDYEISFDLKRIFSDYKGYFDYQDGVAGVYQGHRDDKNKIKLIMFNRKTNGASN